MNARYTPLPEKLTLPSPATIILINLGFTSVFFALWYGLSAFGYAFPLTWLIVMSITWLLGLSYGQLLYETNAWHHTSPFEMAQKFHLWRSLSLLMIPFLGMLLSLKGVEYVFFGNIQRIYAHHIEKLREFTALVEHWEDDVNVSSDPDTAVTIRSAAALLSKVSAIGWKEAVHVIITSSLQHEQQFISSATHPLIRKIVRPFDIGLTPEERGDMKVVTERLLVWAQNEGYM